MPHIRCLLASLQLTVDPLNPLELPHPTPPIPPPAFTAETADAADTADAVDAADTTVATALPRHLPGQRRALYVGLETEIGCNIDNGMGRQMHGLSKVRG